MGFPDFCAKNVQCVINTHTFSRPLGRTKLLYWKWPLHLPGSPVKFARTNLNYTNNDTNLLEGPWVRISSSLKCSSQINLFSAPQVAVKITESGLTKEFTGHKEHFLNDFGIVWNIIIFIWCYWNTLVLFALIGLGFYPIQISAWSKSKSKALTLTLDQS